MRGVSNFEFKPLITDFKGYNSAKDKTVLEDGWLVKGSQNVYKKRSGTIAIRPGLKRRGTADTTEAGVKSEYVWYTSLGKTIPLRVCNSKLQFESDIATSGTYVWYDLMTSLTLTDFSFRPWWDNTDKKDKLVFVKGDTNLHSWAGGITNVASGTVNTITKTSATTTWAQDGFASTGTVTINGVDYAYTGGANTQTLTGVTPDASGITANVGFSKIVTQATTPASTFTNNFLEVVNNQIYVFSSTSRLVYICENDDLTDWTEPSTRVAGDPKIIVLDNVPNGVAVRNGKAHIFAGTSDLYIVSFTDITVGTNLVNQCNVDKKGLAVLHACLGHNFIDVVGDTIVYLSQDQQLRTYGDYKNLFQPVFPPLSIQVFDELSDENFTGGHLRAIGEYVYITSPLNGRTYLHQTRQSIDPQGTITYDRLWHPPMIWNVARVTEIDGVVFGHSNANPQIYQIWDTGQWHDDSPSDENLSYKGVIALSYRNHGRRMGVISFDKVYYEGYVTQGSKLYGDVLFEYQGAESSQVLPINEPNKTAKLYTGVISPSLGDSSFGDNPFGQGLSTLSDQDLLPKFKDIESVTQVNCTEYQLTVYSEDVDSRWELLAIGTNATMSDEAQAVEIIKKS